MAGSAGKNVSSASSASVMSTGVPNTLVVLMNERVPAGVVRRKGTTTPAYGAVAGEIPDVATGHPVVAKLSEQLRQNRIGGHHDLPQAGEHVGVPIGDVLDPLRQAVRVKAQAKHDDGPLQQRRRHAVKERRHRPVVGNQVPVAIDRQGRLGLLGTERPVYSADFRALKRARSKADSIGGPRRSESAARSLCNRGSGRTATHEPPRMLRLLPNVHLGVATRELSRNHIEVGRTARREGRAVLSTQHGSVGIDAMEERIALPVGRCELA